MLKKQDDAVGARPSSPRRRYRTPTLETEDEVLIKTYREHLAEKGKSAVDQKAFTDGQDQPSD